jgi:hypothetical protein
MNLNKALICALLAVSAQAAQIRIDVLDATVKDKRVSGASVILQQTGETSLQAKTDASGKATITSPKAIKSDALLIIKKEGYSDLVAQCPCDKLTYALSPVMKSLDGMRIVLSWGAAPDDLDSHLLYGVNGHIFFDDKSGRGAKLDVDDTDSFGPETITIENLQPNQTYIYAVADYTNAGKPRASALSRSGAKVFVYAGSSLLKTYGVPRDRDLEGNVWMVFRIDPNGQITDLDAINGVNYYGGVNEVKSALASKIRQFADGAAITKAVGASAVKEAEELNKLGEKAYHAGDIEGSIYFYQAAARLDPTFAQAYSNMGLSYRKLNRFSESMWANRKALSLANGDDARIVRASSFYEIARLYEQNKDFALSIRYYEQAKSENDNPAYDKAIARVKVKAKL